MFRLMIIVGLTLGALCVPAVAEKPGATRSEALPANLFDGQGATLSASGRAALDAIAAKAGRGLIIEAAFATPSARRLADRRAAAVERYLKGKGVKTTRSPSRKYISEAKPKFGFASLGAYLGLRKNTGMDQVPPPPPPPPPPSSGG